MKNDPVTIKVFEELAELGFVEKLPPRPGETEPCWRLPSWASPRQERKRPSKTRTPSSER